jgi:sugar (pentulose or hexulose) kinase
MPSAAHPSARVAPPVVAGVDVATAAVRVLCVDASGAVRGKGSAQLPRPVRDGRGRSEQDARSWWPATARALRQATAALPGGGREVRAVAVSATSGTIALIGSDGAPLGPALMYDDRRAAGLNARAQEAGSARWAALGLTVGPTAALGRVAWWAALAAKGSRWGVTWPKSPDGGPGEGPGGGPGGDLGHGRVAGAREDSGEDPRDEPLRAALSGTAPGTPRVLHTPDLIGEALTGGPVAADWSHALKTGYDPRLEEWPSEVLEALAIPASWLPDVAAPGTRSGTVCAGAAAETGLPEGIVVRLGMTDGCAGQLATGAVRPGQFVGVLGTTYVLKGVTRELATDPGSAFYSHRHPDGRWLPGGASSTGGEALEGTSRERLRALDAAAGARGPAGCVSYPLRREGERFPFVSADARGFTVGAPADETEAHRAALEGVAFVERLSVERIRALGVPVTEPLYAAGGGSRSELWSRIRATVLGTPLWVADTAETAFGAALLAAVGTLHPSLDDAAAAMAGGGRQVEPVRAERQALDDSYGRFLGELRARGWLAA